MDEVEQVVIEGVQKRLAALGCWVSFAALRPYLQSVSNMQFRGEAATEWLAKIAAQGHIQARLGPNGKAMLYAANGLVEAPEPKRLAAANLVSTTSVADDGWIVMQF